MKGKFMKKSIILCLSILFLTTACFFNNGITKEEFKDHFSALGYTISTDLETDVSANNYYVASKEDMPFTIDYYDFSDESSAKIAYSNFTADDYITKYITSNSKNNSLNGSYFDKFTVDSDNEYLVFSRVKNTLIVVMGTQEYKSEIDNLLTDIEYDGN